MSQLKLTEEIKIKLQAFEEAGELKRIEHTFMYRLAQAVLRVERLLQHHEMQSTYIERHNLRRAIDGEPEDTWIKY